MNRADRREYVSKHGWEPWQECDHKALTEEQISGIMAAGGISRDDVIKIFVEEISTSRIVKNNIYQVAIKDTMLDGQSGHMLHLSIKRIDRKPVGIERFRDFQRIKNELVGPENEAVEIYPAESRLVDSANQYHLWTFKRTSDRFPFGMSDRRFVTGESHAGAVQQPFERETQP